MKALSTLLGLGLGLASAVGAQSPLTTLFAGPNGLLNGGVVFVNMTINVPAITVNRIDVNSNSAVGTQGRIRVWQTLPAFPFFSGSEAIAANWQLLAEGSVISAGNDLPSTVCFPVPFTLTSAMGGRGYAIEHIGVGPRYTNGTGANQIYNNVEISLNAGAAGGGSPYADPVVATGQAVNPFYTGTNNPRVFNGAFHYAIGSSAPVCSFSDKFARGCGDTADTFFDLSMIPAQASPKLTGRQVVMSINGFGGYTVTTVPSGGLVAYASHLPLTGFATTIAGAVATDDGEVVVPLTLGSVISPNGPISSLVVHTNGMVSTASNMAFLDAFAGGGDDWAPNVQALLSAPNETWFSWHDFDLTTAGEIRFFEDATQAVITYVGVQNAFGAVTDISTFQFVFSYLAPTVTMAWETVAPAFAGGALAYSGNPWLVGYSPAGASVRPEVATNIAANGSSDLVATALVTNSLVLSSDPRPTFGSILNYNVGSFPLYANGTPYGFPFGQLNFSVTNPSAPGFPLSFVGVGRPGCLLNYDLSAAIGPFDFFAPGLALSVNTNTVTPSMLGLDFWGQSFVVDVLGDILGSLVTSNALHQRVELN